MLRSTLALLVLCPLAAADSPPAPFASKDGRFAVALPDAPKEKDAKAKFGDAEVAVKLFTVGQKDRAFVVTYSDYPKAKIGADRDAFVAERVENNVSGLKGKVLANDKLTLGKGKHPGREVRVELADKKQLYRARAFLVGERLYQVAVLGPDEFVKGKEADAFFASFTVEE
jgi:hypothetical protein